MPRVDGGGRGRGRGGGRGRGKGRGGAGKGRKAGKKRHQARNTTSNRVVIDNSDDENLDNGASTKKKYKKKGRAETGLLEQAAREVIRAKKANGNRVPHRLLEEKVQELNGLEDVKMDLAAVGSGRHLAGRSDEIVQAASSVSADSFQADRILGLIQATRERNLGRRQTTEGLMADSNNPDVRRERLRIARSVTSGIVFYGGDGRLGPEVLEAVQRRIDEKIEKASAILRKKRKILKDIKRQVDEIRKKLSNRKFKIEKLLVRELKLLCRWKKEQGDKPLPTRKADLIARFKATKARTSPTVSPSNSDDEAESDEDGDSVDAYDSDATAPTDDEPVFGHDSDGEIESSDEEDEESDEGGEEEYDEDDSS